MSAQNQKNNAQRILGIDLGTSKMGFGVIEGEQNMRALEYGIVSTKKDLSQSERISDLYDNINDLIRKWRPNYIAIEEIFFIKNKKTAIEVASARGITLLAAEKSNIAPFLFTPLQVKQAVTGFGRADKKQVQEMVKRLLKMEKEPRPDDAADALAVAICCANSMPALKIISSYK